MSVLGILKRASRGSLRLPEAPHHFTTSGPRCLRSGLPREPSQPASQPAIQMSSSPPKSAQLPLDTAPTFKKPVKTSSVLRLLPGQCTHLWMQFRRPTHAHIMSMYHNIVSRSSLDLPKSPVSVSKMMIPARLTYEIYTWL